MLGKGRRYADEKRVKIMFCLWIRAEQCASAMYDLKIEFENELDKYQSKYEYSRIAFTA